MSRLPKVHLDEARDAQRDMLARWLREWLIECALLAKDGADGDGTASAVSAGMRDGACPCAGV